MNFAKIEDGGPGARDGKYGAAQGGIVVTSFPEATRAGVRMLEKGGNAVDAACAASLALSVCEPQSSGLGGQAMGIVHIHGRTVALDGSGRIPSLAHMGRISQAERGWGYRAAAVPSLPAFTGYLHLRYGRLQWSEIVAPAVDLAVNGYRISPLQHEHQKRQLDDFLRVASRSGARYFLRNGREPYGPGERFVQPDLGNLLELIAEEGPRGFYLGKIAKRIEEDMVANGGFLRADDLALIPWPVERPALVRDYREFTVCTVPPPAAGRALLLVLMMLNHLEPSFIGQVTPQSAHFLAETFRKALLQRHLHPFDPKYYGQTPDRVMGSGAFARDLVASIRDTIDPLLPLKEPRSVGNDTTHLSVMDEEGNAVGISQSIESIYGSKTAAEGLGFLYNNYLNTMETKDPAHPYYLRPNAVPKSSVAPAILFHRGEPWLTVGSPGSERIFSTMAQFLIHLVDGRNSLAEAVEKPRMHCSMGGEISIEADRFDPEVISHLGKIGYRIDRRPPYSLYLGAIYAAMRCRTRKGFQGVAEFRREGLVAGPD